MSRGLRQRVGTAAVQGGQKHLRRLTSLRAFAALLVFLFHVDIRGGTVGPIRAATKYGFVGVAFFFVLSGFVLAWSSRPDDRPAAFYTRRFARIYPSYLIVFVLCLLIPQGLTAFSPAGATATGLLVQAWWPAHIYDVNDVAWSLSCEVAFYAVLPALLPWMRRTSRMAPLAAAGAYWVAASAVAIWLASHGLHDMAYAFPPLRFGEFALGAAAAIAMKRGWRMTLWQAGCLFGVGAVLFVALHGRWPLSGVGATLIFFVIILLVAQRDLGDRGGWLGSRPLIYAGQVSFAFYLIHELVIITLARHIHLSRPVMTLLMVVVSCAAAVLLHHAVEHPAEARLRRLRLSGQVKPAAVTAHPVDG